MHSVGERLLTRIPNVSADAGLATVVLVLGSAVAGTVSLVWTARGTGPPGELIDLVSAIERLEVGWLIEIGRIRTASLADFAAESDLVARTAHVKRGLAMEMDRSSGLSDAAKDALSRAAEATATLAQEARSVKSALAELRRWSAAMLGAADDVASTPDVPTDLVRPVLTTVTDRLGGGWRAGDSEPPLTPVGVDALRTAMPPLGRPLVQHVERLVSAAEEVLKRQMLVRTALAEFESTVGAMDVAGRELRGALGVKPGSPVAEISSVVALLLMAAAVWTGSRTYRGASMAANGSGAVLPAPVGIVAVIVARHVAAGVRDVRDGVSMLRTNPLYARGARTVGAKTLDSVQDIAAGIARTVGRLEAFAAMRKSGVQQVGTVALRSIVQSVVAATGQRKLFDVDGDDVLVLGSNHDLRVMIGNIVANAVEATGPVENGRVWVAVSVAEDIRAVVAVTDNGPGMAETVRARVFEPFFTTKTGHKGMGLAVARHLAQRWRGSVHIDPAAVGRGATVRLSLPLASRQ